MALSRPQVQASAQGPLGPHIDGLEKNEFLVFCFCSYLFVFVVFHFLNVCVIFLFFDFLFDVFELFELFVCLLFRAFFNMVVYLFCWFVFSTFFFELLRFFV